MHRFHISPAACQAPLLTLAGREAHHALHVLRLDRGDTVTVLDGDGGEYLCDVLDVHRDHLALKVRQKNTFPPLPCQVTLIQAVPKGKIIEAIIQKATELGVARIAPVLSERVVTHLEDHDSVENKHQKWHQIAVEAIKQCGQPWLPQVEPPQSLKQFLARPEYHDLTLVASLQPDARHPRAIFDDYRAAHPPPPASVAIWIGPEGDFTPAEMSAIKSAGALPITLGRLVLRVETASIYALSVINYELQCI